MSIKVNLDLLLVQRQMSLTELSEKTGITIQNLSILKTRKGKAIRFSTLASICHALKCSPGDLLVYDHEKEQAIGERLLEL